MSKQNRNCQIPTPISYAEEMLDYVGYRHDLWGRKVLENSCGEGNILVEIARRYIADAKQKNYAPKRIARGLQEDIIAYEIDQEKITICIDRLNALASSENLPEVAWSIRKQDFLKSEIGNMDFIIGNPPYITYHDLTEEERKFLQNTYTVCKRGRFDYCYAFIEASVKALAGHGKMAYLIPFSIFRNKFAAGLRTFLREHITGIIDYRGINVFPGVICSNAVVICEKNVASGQIQYENRAEKSKLLLNRSDFDKEGRKWVFYRSSGGSRRFGNYFSIHNSIATLYNEAFIFQVEDEDERYYVINNMRIEKEVTLPAVSTKSSRASKKNNQEIRIVFPYKKDKGSILRFEETEFHESYPCAWEYLRQYYEKLLERKADEKAKWFEYGRSQALTNLFGEKLIMPMVITDSTRTYYAGYDGVPYAGYFITMKSGSEMNLQNAKDILESAAFYQYVKDVGTPTTISSYRVSVHDISEFTF